MIIVVFILMGPKFACHVTEYFFLSQQHSEYTESQVANHRDLESTTFRKGTQEKSTTSHC